MGHRYRFTVSIVFLVFSMASSAFSNDRTEDSTKISQAKNLVQQSLQADHLSAASRDAVKLAVGLVATTTALLLGLLVSLAKNTYDTQRTPIMVMASKVSFLGRVLQTFGPETAEARELIRAAAVDGVQRMWPDEPGARGELTGSAPTGDGAYASLQAQTPRDDFQRSLKEQAITLATAVGRIRILMPAEAVLSLPRILLLSVGSWLVVIFLSFGLLAPPNGATALSLAAAPLSVAVTIFLRIELNQPLGGMIRISSELMNQAFKILTGT
jgi:hypothetical protein